LNWSGSPIETLRPRSTAGTPSVPISGRLLPHEHSQPSDIDMGRQPALEKAKGECGRDMNIEAQKVGHI